MDNLTEKEKNIVIFTLGVTFGKSKDDETKAISKTLFMKLAGVSAEELLEYDGTDVVRMLFGKESK